MLLRGDVGVAVLLFLALVSFCGDSGGGGGGGGIESLEEVLLEWCFFSFLRDESLDESCFFFSLRGVEGGGGAESLQVFVTLFRRPCRGVSGAVIS